MKFYFSGVADQKIRDVLVKAGVTNFLADPTDFQLLPKDAGNSLALDSGAYRAFKKGQAVDVEAYTAFIAAQECTLDFCVSPDVIGDAETSFRRWDTLWENGIPLLPVWHYQADRDQLDIYLKRSELVGIGGLVTPMREKDESVLQMVQELCEQYPKRFHLFGVNWLKGMMEVKETCASIDTSKFLDAARYGHVLFVNTKTGKLSQCPAKIIPELSELNREQRLIVSASNMRRYFADEQIQSAFGLESLDAQPFATL